MTFLSGGTTVLGDRYRLVERIAAGGQGEVWRAEDTTLGRQVAVKVLRQEYADSAEFRDRFRREAQHAAGLSHPGVAQVFDYDEGAGDTPPYLVMEYVDGESLSATIAREAPLSPDRVLDIIAAVASALTMAHAAGLVHRDVKPGNLLTGHDGSIKITDFGIARAVDAIPLTRTGTLLGTPLYLAPEQASGMQATAASDLYALGIIAFESLTGRPPYEGPAAAVLLAHRDAPLPTLPPAVPSGLRDLVLALTAKDPAMRPADAAGVVDWAARLRTDPTPAIPLLPRPAAPLPHRHPGRSLVRARRAHGTTHRKHDPGAGPARRRRAATLPPSASARPRRPRDRPAGGSGRLVGPAVITCASADGHPEPTGPGRIRHTDQSGPSTAHRAPAADPAPERPSPEAAQTSEMNGRAMTGPSSP
jgi:serine/threonine protein kinase